MTTRKPCRNCEGFVEPERVSISARCLPCNRVHWREYRADPTNKERLRAATKARRDSRRAHCLRRGITLDQYDEMVAARDACCDVCGEPDDNLRIDHDHDTGEIRGLLCTGCNSGLGAFGDDLDGVMRAYLYLKKHEASLGG